MCPHCRSDAPLIYRGVRAYCAACGHSRVVLSAASVTYAGAPQQVGGTLVRAFGMAFLMVGLSIGALVALLVGLIASATAGLVTFAVFSAISAGLYFAFNAGGKRLEAEGEGERDFRRQQALAALAKNHDGALLAPQAAAALDLSVEEADQFLTKLAKTKPDEIGVEIGERGEVFYTFKRHLRGPWGWASFMNFRTPRPAPAPRVRVETAGFSGERAGRYADDPAATSAPPAKTRVSSAPVAKPPTELKIVDADFEEIEEPVAPRRLIR